MASPISMQCASCRKLISKQGDSLLALKDTWHKDCFRCSKCKTRLQQEYFNRHNMVYCRQHYLEKYAHSCHRCFRIVTGLIIVTGDVSFHPECFRCMKCRCVIGHGDNYVFEERSQLYCVDCYENDIGQHSRYKEFNRAFQKGTIHQVQISPSKIKQLSFKYKEPQKENLLSGLQKKLKPRNRPQRVSIISSEDVANASLLQTGDTVLEINGTPITNNNIKEFSALLQSTDSSKRISITIERTAKPLLNTDATNSQSPRQNDNNSTNTAIDNNNVIDPDTYNRNMSFFNYDVFRRTSDSSAAKKKMTLGKLRPVKENVVDGLTASDRQKLKRTQGTPPVKTPPQPIEITRITRSKSLSDIASSPVDDDQFLIKKDLMKVESPLHRAQSFKVETNGDTQNQIFRPTDIEFGETVGQGFFGSVIKVVDKVSGKEMVVKKLFDMAEEALEAFLKELHVLKSLKHPNVLQFIGVLYKDTILHLILEYIQGGTLRQLLKHKHVELSWQKKIQLAKDIAAGMAYLHSQHIMHRDLKSKNVLIKKKEGEYTAVVADFGLASIMFEDPSVPPSPNGTNTRNPMRPIFRKRHTVVGSPYWMSPEMLHGQPYDEAADIYSHGIVMCEIISRLSATPEEIPRDKRNYGLDVVEFKKKIDAHCPEMFFQMTAACCSVVPTNRPPLDLCVKWLDVLLTNLKFEIPLPDVIDFMSEPKPLRLKSLSARNKKKFKETTMPRIVPSVVISK